MTKVYKKITALFLMFLIVCATVFGSAGPALAGGIDEGEEKAITDVEIYSGLSQDDCYYPASFKYVLKNLQIKVTFEDGTSAYLQNWYAGDSDSDWYYFAIDDSSRYFMRFYDAEGEQVKITNDEVPFGEFKMEITRNTTPVFAPTKTFKIVDEAPTGNVENCTAEFSSTDRNKFEETWYPITLEQEKEYVFATGGWSQDYWFADLWVKNENGTVRRVNKGCNGGYDSEDAFSHRKEGNDQLYLVIGEMYQNSSCSGNVQWTEKKTVGSVALLPENAYKAWNDDISKIPLKVTYTDGSAETLSSWKWGYNSESYVEGYYLYTANMDKIWLGVYENDAWENYITYASWKPGTKKWKAYLESDSSISSEKEITIATPSAKTLTLTEGEFENFSISSENEAYYQLKAETNDTVEIVNSGKNKMSVSVFSRASETDSWNMTVSSLLGSGKTEKSTVTAGKEYLFILHTDETARGTIGKYVSDGLPVSAAVGVEQVDAADYTVWVNLPITVTYGKADSNVMAGSQEISNWNGGYGYSSAVYAYTKYNNYKVYYTLSQGTEQINIPVVSEELLILIQEHGDNPEKLEMILEEYGISGGLDALCVKPGSYTVNVYRDSVSEENKIGSKNITVINSSVCTSHSWNAGKITKQPSCTAAGSKVYTCTKCGETKTETLKALGHNYSTGWTVDQPATLTANGSQSHHCTRCSAKTGDKVIYKASGVKLAYTAVVYSGKAKSPEVVVKDSKGNKISAANYTVVKPSGRTNVGKYTYKVVFKNAYKGTKALYLTINPKASSVKSLSSVKKGFTVKWSKVSKQAAGYEIMYATNSKFTKNKKTVKVNSYKTTSKTITKLSSKKTYWVKIRTYKTVNGKPYYSAWSKAKTVKTK